MTETIQHLSQLAAGALFSSIWQGLVLAAAISICMKFAPRTSAGIRFMLWGGVFLAIATLPVLAVLPGHRGTPAGPIEVPSHVLQLDSRWALAFVVLWAIFAAVRMVGLAKNALRVKSLWKRATPIEAQPGILSQSSATRWRRAALCVSDEVDQPCVIGFFSPRILIPRWLLEESTVAELEQVVLHETAHLRRFDDWSNLLQKLALACFPLNPALLWVERRLGTEREAACDEIVVRVTNAPREYAICLTNLAEQRLSRRAAALSLGALGKRSQLASRIESILRGGVEGHPLKSRAVAAAFVLAIVAGTIKLGSSAQLISFVSPERDQAAMQRNEIAPTTSTGGIYHDVVFHPTSDSKQPLLHAEKVSASPAKLVRPRPAVKHIRRLTDRSSNQVQSFIIVTRWQDVSGRQLTVIDHVVRISAPSVAPSQAGWLVFQL